MISICKYLLFMNILIFIYKGIEYKYYKKIKIKINLYFIKFNLIKIK